MKLLLTGGIQRNNASKLGEGRRYCCATLVRADFRRRSVETLLALDEAGAHYPDDTPNITFTSGTMAGDSLYLCTETEVFVYSYPELRLQKTASFPFLNNSHHVAPVAGFVAIVSTGLDMVVLLDKSTLEPRRFTHVLGGDPWERASRDTDYRKVHSTKPHAAHPNFVFEIDGEIWATRFNQKDAVSLDNPARRIDIGVERVHDGHVVGDSIYFTCVDGHIVVVDKNTLKKEAIIDLNQLEETDMPLGWCRGLLIDGDTAFVGFTRIRKTPIKENVKWLLSHVGRANALPTRVVEYDLKARRKVAEYAPPRHSVDAIYSVLRPSA